MVDAEGRAYASANFNQPLAFGSGWSLTTGYDSPDFDALYLIQIDDSNISSVFSPVHQPLRAFPNPAAGSLSVELPGQGQLQLLSSTGQRVWAVAHAGGLQYFTLPALPAGLYLLQGQTRQQRYLARIVIE